MAQRTMRFANKKRRHAVAAAAAYYYRPYAILAVLCVVASSADTNIAVKDGELQINPGENNIVGCVGDFHVYGALSVGAGKPGTDVAKKLVQCATDNELLLERVAELENRDAITAAKVRKLEEAGKADAEKVEELTALVTELLKTTTTTTTQTTVTSSTVTTTTLTTATTTTTPFVAGSQQMFGELQTNPQTYVTVWTVPEGVTSISAVCVGGGGAGDWPDHQSHYGAGGGGGALAYINDWEVTPGSQLRVHVGAGGQCSGVRGGHSWIDLVGDGSSKVIEAPAGGNANSHDWAGDAGPTSSMQISGKKCAAAGNAACDWFPGGKGGLGNSNGRGPGGGGGTSATQSTRAA